VTGTRGERNPQNRGKSKYVRISWDEATDIIAGEVRRVIKAYGPEAILSQCDGHGETKIVHPSHACNLNLLDHLGGYTLQARNPDSWRGGCGGQSTPGGTSLWVWKIRPTSTTTSPSTRR